MKVFEFCICALACISLTSSMTLMHSLGEQPNSGMQFVNSCAIEAGLNYEDGYDIRDIIDDDIEKSELQEKTQKHGCVMECLLRKLNWMEGSELKEEKFYADMDKIFANHPLKIQIDEFIRDCATKVKNTPQEECKRGVVAMKCGVKGAHRLFPIAGLNEDGESEEDGNN
ncbi:PREDICTED: pheromone-binding protein Gp-9-like [Vollenhovia emeryi]|uniref:pheromone-binding protein Gp-9-like n=1 Tax=Vollenhovia emeryi TaxID=411798 RepID=UPI0005F4BB80|nr:PREDICTED: pheromone-binding protein Gp-9-like [Vollenhovia emeryi]